MTFYSSFHADLEFKFSIYTRFYLLLNAKWSLKTCSQCHLPIYRMHNQPMRPVKSGKHGHVSGKMRMYG